MRPFVPVKQRLMILIASMFVLSACIIVFIILPTAKKIIVLGQEIHGTEKFLETQYQKIRQLRQSIVRLDTIAESASRFDGAIINSGDELRIITELEALAEAEHIQQSFLISHHDAEKGGKGVRLPFIIFSFTNQGEFANHLRYIQALEKINPYVFIDAMTWEKKQISRQETAETIVLRFDAKIYIKEAL